jgi:hypothetical protein
VAAWPFGRSVRKYESAGGDCVINGAGMETPTHRASQKQLLEPDSQHLEVPQLWCADSYNIAKLSFH